jgi:predicted DNA-binding transcriptional regulator YafY
MSRKGQSITISLKEPDRIALLQLAEEFGIRWGQKPNLSKLIEAIARRELLVSQNSGWSEEKIQALVAAHHALIDLGQTNVARIVAQILLDRSELTIPLRNELAKNLDNPLPPWRQKIDELLFQHRPFSLKYRDAAEKESAFTIVYGEIRLIEKRQYLACKCIEINQDIPSLQHNWFLRLDRIQNAVIAPTKEKWGKGLDTILVELHLTNGLAFAYEEKILDLEARDLDCEQPTKRVVRQVSSTFWLFREILPYGEDCEIMAPVEIRDLFAKKVQCMDQKYRNGS